MRYIITNYSGIVHTTTSRSAAEQWVRYREQSPDHYHADHYTVTPEHEYRGHRDQYGAILLSRQTDTIRKQLTNLVNAAAKAARVDEHGAWQFGCEFDKKGRGYATNWDLYGYGRDLHSNRLLAVIQVRQSVRQRANGYLNIHKSYFLLGRNEDNSVFAHPVESRAIHAAIKRGGDIVPAVQSWIFGADYAKVLRHGDLALIPTSRPQGEQIPAGTCVLEGSHEIAAAAYRDNGNLYALNPEVSHIPGVHPDVCAQGWYQIVVGRRTDTWSFAKPTID